ncbi:MAG TPA: hypothetical protein VJJ24_00735 [Candidatus Paceibacterota bacterium]
MYVLLTISVLSLAGIVTVIGRRQYASKPIEVPIFSQLSRHIDIEGHATRIAPIVKRHGVGAFLLLKQHFLILIHSFLKVTAPIFVSAERSVQKRLVLMVNAVKGKGSLNKKGAASIYLKRLSKNEDSINL